MRPYLRVANVFEARIDTSDVMRMNFTPREFETFHLRHGDILLNEGQSLELIGRPAMFRDEIRECCFQNTLVRFRASEAVNREYALLVFRSYLHNGQFQRIAKITTNLAHLGAERFAQMEFPLPPFDEQSEIVRLVEGRLSASDRLSSTLDQQISRAQETRQSLLRQAFQGQLVQQDAEDEPASVLLDRVQVIRALAAAKPKGKSMTRNRTKPHGTRRTLQEILSESDKPMTPEELFRAAGFEFSQVDQFYRELATLRISLTEQKPEDSEAKAWPHGSKVLLQLKKKAKQ
jgi:type I restriction enzyme S subunit